MQMVVGQEGRGAVKGQKSVIVKAWKGPDRDVKDIPKRRMLCGGGSGQKVSDNREVKSRWGTGRVPCGGGKPFLECGRSRTQLHNDGGAMWERGKLGCGGRRGNQMGKGILGVGDRSHSMLTD